MSRSGSTPIVVGAGSTDADGLHAQAARRAQALAGAGTVAVVAHATVDTVVSVLAGLESGVTVVPVSPDAGPRERDHVLRDSGAALVMDGDVVSDGPGPAGTSDPDAALLLYTSGTTGPPKGVPISAAAIAACLDGLARAWEWTPDDTLVHGLPLHHVHGLVLGVLGPLRVGCALHHTGRPTPSAYAAAGGSLFFGVPTVWSRLAAEPASARALASARLLVSGSAALPAPVFDSLVALTGQAPVERYGMTETLITLAAHADAPRIRGSVGHALPGVDVRIVDDEGNVVGDGAMGGLEVSGPTVFRGYRNHVEATAMSFTPDGWFRTGDIGVAGDDGFRIVGRASTDLIKSGGYRIGAGEVEDALLSHPAVSEAAVIGVADDDLGQRIVAFVVSDDIDEQALIDHVAATLSVHKRPRLIRRVATLPRNAMGKVDKSRLRA